MGLKKYIVCPKENNEQKQKSKFSNELVYPLEENTFIDFFIDVKKLKIVELIGCNLSLIPYSFRDLNLTHLNLSHNKFSEIPLCVSIGMKSLEALDVGWNDIKYFAISDTVSHLKVLKLNDNSFQTIPHWFLTFVCANLEDFDYSHNRAEHYDYWKYSYLDKVKIMRLKLRNACLIDQDLPILKRFRNLQCLDISNDITHEPRVLKQINKFQDLDVLFIRHLWKNLTSLEIQNLNLVLFPPGILWITSLRELNISYNYISWICEDIEYLYNLEFLDISNNHFIALPKNIQNLLRLETIRAQHNKIEEVTVLPESLRFLDLYDNIIDSVLCDISLINCDLEWNFININTCQYVKQKNIFRKKFEEDNRLNICKPQLEICNSPDSRSSDTSDYQEGYNTSLSEEMEKSDWEKKNIDYNIEEYNFGRVYVSDEEWMFEDVE